jgi:hypothetical protein
MGNLDKYLQKIRNDNQPLDNQVRLLKKIDEINIFIYFFS